MSICDAIRTPFGRYGGALSSVRADDLGAIPIAALMARHPGLNWAAVDDVIHGGANQAGEAQLMIAGGVESTSRAPLVMPGVVTLGLRTTTSASTRTVAPWRQAIRWLRRGRDWSPRR